MRVLIAAFDGLQPAQISPVTTPFIWELACQGVWFDRHHSVFPSVTRVNTASMVTGRRPGGHGLPGNTLYAPEVDEDRHIDALLHELTRLEAATGGNVLLAETLAEILAPHQMQYVALSGGTSGNAFVQFPRPARSRGALIHPEFTRPESLRQEITDRFGYWPPKISPATGLSERVATVYMDFVRPRIDPEVCLLWFPEPDTSQHVHGVGSRPAREAIAIADAQLGRIMEHLRKAGQETVVFVISDHGYSTIAGTVSVENELSRAGFMTGRMGGIHFAPNGGAGLLYVQDHDPETVDRLAGWLAGRDWVGGIASGRPGAEPSGVLPGSVAGVTGERAPDLVFSFKWDMLDGANGFRGRVFATNGAVGSGTHGSGSPQELRATLIAAGPGIRKGLRSPVPSGQHDLVPTVLKLLGLPRPKDIEGRVLEEAFVDGPEPLQIPVDCGRIEATRKFADGALHQRMDVDRVNGAVYVSGLGRAADFPSG